MAGFEDLIRSTLEKQGNPSAERRAAIYASSRQALERMLAQNDRIDETTRELQRDRLDRAIDTIEADYANAAPRSEPENTVADPPLETPTSPAPVDPVPPPTPREPMVPVYAPGSSGLTVPPAPTPEPGDVGASTPYQPAEQSVQPSATGGLVPPPQPRMNPAPELESEGPPAQYPDYDDGLSGLVAERSGAPHSVDPAEVAPPTPPHIRREPDFDVSDEPLPSPSDRIESDRDYDGRLLRERRPYAKLLLWAIILAGIGVAIWWAVTFGPALLKAQFDGAVQNPPARIETGSFVPESDGGWVTIFAPDSNPENIDTSSGGRAELVRVEGRAVARIVSPDRGDDRTIRIGIPRGVMESLRGKAATFELQIAGPDDAAQQFAIYCEFSVMGECGRKRYRARAQAEPYLFDMLVNDASLPEGEDAYLAIDTDIGEGSAALDLYSVRVRTGG